MNDTRIYDPPIDDRVINGDKVDPTENRQVSTKYNEPLNKINKRNREIKFLSLK